MISSLGLVRGELGNSPPLDLDPLPVGAPRGDSHSHRTINCLSLNLTPQNSLSNGDILRRADIEVLPDKPLILFDLELDDQIPRLTSIDPRVPLPGHPQVLTRRDPSRDLDYLLLSSIGNSLSLAGSAGTAVD